MNKKKLSKEEVQSFFNAGAAYRDEFNNPYVYYMYFKKREDIIKLIPKYTRNLLDVGCGTGTFEEILSLSQNKCNFDVSGTDISKKSIEIAKSKRLLNSIFLCGDAENLPFKNKSFDCIVLIEVIEHIPNKESVFKELKRVLKRNGKIIITTPNKRDIILRVHNLLKNIGTKIIGKKIIHKDEYLSKEELSILLKNVGFNINEETVKYFMPLTLSVYSMTLGIIPPLPSSLCLRLLKVMVRIEQKYKIPSLLKEYFAGTIFIVAEKRGENE